MYEKKREEEEEQEGEEVEEEERWTSRAIVGDRSTDLADKLATIRPSRSDRELPKVINPLTVTQAT